MKFALCGGRGRRIGTGDAANLLKPALARGTLRTIGATTERIQSAAILRKDPALTAAFSGVADCRTGRKSRNGNGAWSGGYAGKTP
ncbi:hypothetical protein KCP77_21100 [Salmonella enterica subsp. enterica]|nr:hypothetical protein KCP77_21100 [Salmonella enterica subsp. enterica]